MNEQLVVKNFGPIKDATVDFKKVTVFIGPTGGGKSTLAKLAAVFRDDNILRKDVNAHNKKEFEFILSDFQLGNYLQDSGYIQWLSDDYDVIYGRNILRYNTTRRQENFNTGFHIFNRIAQETNSINPETIFSSARPEEIEILSRMFGMTTDVYYIPAERSFAASIESGLAGLMRGSIALPNIILDFINKYSQARENTKLRTIPIPFLSITYKMTDTGAKIELADKKLIDISQTASGVHTIVPLILVIKDATSRNFKVSPKSFVVEEPELNLFPLAQFELVKMLVDICAQRDGQNDLTMTTHSPYVLTALNLMCYAYRIAQQDESTAKKVAKLIPRECWIDPEQFAAYYVDLPSTKKKQQVRSIINKKTGLIEENELDTASLELGNIFEKLVRLRQPAKTVTRAK